jgi:hypothetical protein
MKRLWLCSILALLLAVGVSADPSDTGTLVTTLSETGKLPGDAVWGGKLTEALAAETAELHPLNPLTLTIIAESITGFSENGDPAAAAVLIAEAMRTADRQIRRGIAQARIRQEARRSLSGLNGLRQPPAAAGKAEMNRGRGAARSILDALDKPGGGNIPFSSIPGQGPSSVPERREEGDDDHPGPPF